MLRPAGLRVWLPAADHRPDSRTTRAGAESVIGGADTDLWITGRRAVAVTTLFFPRVFLCGFRCVSPRRRRPGGYGAARLGRAEADAGGRRMRTGRRVGTLIRV
jgi:hypothetical protein